MTVDATSLCITQVHADEVDNVDFAILCVYMRSRFSALMPVTPRRMVLMSLFGSSYNFYSELFKLGGCHDPKCCVTAVTVLAKIISL